MDEQQYAEEGYEGYAEYETRSPLWMWIVLALAVVAAIVFGALWYMRGGEIGRLTGEMRSARSAADTAAQNLQRDLDAARSQTSSGAARIAELERRLQNEQRQAAETAQQAERRLRDEIDAQAARLREAGDELEELRGRLARAEEREKAATESAAEGSAASERLAAVQERLDAALADAGKVEGLEEELARVREAMANLETTVGDLRASNANIGRELTTANEELRRAEEEREELAEVRAGLDAARQRLAGADSGRGAVPLMANRGTDAGTAVGVAATLRETIAALEEKYAAARKELSEKAAAEAETVDAATDAAALRDRLEEAEKRARDAENAAAAAKAEADSRIAGLAARLEEADGTIARLEEKSGGLETGRGDLDREMASLRDALRAATAEKDRLAGVLAEAEQRVDQAERNSADRVEETERKFEERERELREDFQRRMDELRRQLDAAKTAVETAEANRTEDSSRDAAVIAAAAAPEAQPAPPPMVAASSPEEPRHVIIGDPGRAVGRVAQVVRDGHTYLTTGGARQRVKPGMVFDVHRRSGGMNRYIGLLLVTRVLDDYALASPVHPAREARVCPVTGRVVLDPAANYSSYARSEEGRPVPLIAASVLGLGQEKPVIGDCIDNPYYDPGRILVFTHSGETRDDARSEALIVGLGGMVSDSDAQADYEVVRNMDPDADPLARPRQITADALAAYVMPEYGN